MASPSIRVLVTGSRGFIGRNLVFRLLEDGGFSVLTFDRDGDLDELKHAIEVADVVVHLAGENRPREDSAFCLVNEGLTATVCDLIADVSERQQRSLRLIFTSSIQALQDNPYGRSKLAAERVVQGLVQRSSNSAVIYRLPNVFGKWCRPNYNSVVATFCHQVANCLPITVNDPSTLLQLAYVDDVVTSLMFSIRLTSPRFAIGEVETVYETTVGEIAEKILAFESSRRTLMIESVGSGLTRALYATYVSHIPPERFMYQVPSHEDPRGIFVEMLKTRDSGQFSFFTAHPGVTRGGHYHHSKTEKFLVVKGQALFFFRNLITGQSVEIQTSGDLPSIVDTIPGWVHDITNVGEDEMMVVLWANETFDRARPDTVAVKV